MIISTFDLEKKSTCYCSVMLMSANCPYRFLIFILIQSFFVLKLEMFVFLVENGLSERVGKKVVS